MGIFIEKSSSGDFQTMTPSIDFGQSLMARIYGKHYRKNKGDSPAESRTALCRRVRQFASNTPNIGWVLDLGSGKQVLEQELTKQGKSIENNPLLQQVRGIVTLDIVPFERKDLFAYQIPEVTHVRGDGARLPFADNSFSLVIACMSLETIPGNGLDEIFRILEPGGKLIINNIDPDVVKFGASELKNVPMTRNRREEIRFWNYLQRPDNVFYGEPEEVQERLKDFGLIFDRVQRVSSRTSTWIEIDARKPKDDQTQKKAA